jgi:hypothetical protein
MSGFLGRMVTRALAPQRVLRPRARVAFESYAPVAFEETTWVEAGASARIVDGRATDEQGGARAGDVRHKLHEFGAGLDAGVPSREERLATEVGARPGRPRSGGLEARAPKGARKGARKGDSAEPADALEPGQVGEAGVGSVVVEREVLVAPEVRTIVHTRRGADRVERLRLRSERRTVERELVSEGPIEITIGRIDVRAVVDNPRESPRAARAAAPSMSLRDYLEQRDARRRR